VLIRRERPGDVERIRQVHRDAFRRPEHPDRDPSEAQLVDDLRASDDWIPELSLVAIDAGDGAGEIVGHVVCTRGVILPSSPVLGLGPLGVDPGHQRRGVGLALMHAVIGAADAMGEPLIALLGSPRYYPRFGFVRSTEHGIEPPNPHYGADFQVRTLAAHDPSVTGTFRYAAAFDATEGVT
jgi:putative acetyltransferase